MMSEEIYNQFIGKKVFIILKSNQIYTGVVQSISDGNVLLIDKFFRPVIFHTSDISVMEGKE